MADKKIEKKDLIKLIETYSISTRVGCKAFDAGGKELFSHPGEDESCSFCQLVKEFDQGKEDCRQSYLYGGLQAEKLSDYYIYFCPYGLVNWAVPVLEDNKMKYFFTGGPVLMHKVDDSLIEDIIQQNPLLKHRFNDLKISLNKHEVIDTIRVRYLADLLLRLAKNLMVENIVRLERQQEMNVINARIAETIHGLKKGEINLENGLYPFEKENELILKVKLADKQGAREILNEILGFIYFQSGGKFAIVKSKAIELMVVLARAAIEANADLEIIFGLEYMYLEHIDGVSDIDELSEWLTKVLDRFIECAFSIQNVKNKDIIYKAMSYIRENYDKNISLDEVASEVGLNPSYFSKLFKDEMKISYTDYLNRVRIEAGKQLLKEGHSLVNVAQLVGFNDQSYFSKVFKKIEGVSPGKWRG
ncbi:MAG: two-component system, response regulator YesN [Halanaerobiales bacterium]|nr:two-component system, response regulator YesN [Halanaerobiales bacterium]